MVKNPTWKEVNQLSIFTSLVKDLKSGLHENESSEQSEQDMKSCCLFLSKFTMIYQHITKKIKLCVIQDNEKLVSITT